MCRASTSWFQRRLTGKRCWRSSWSSARAPSSWPRSICPVWPHRRLRPSVNPFGISSGRRRSTPLGLSWYHPGRRRHPHYAPRLTMRIDPAEFRARPLRVHALLHDVPLEDAWAVPLSGGGAGRTIQDLRAVMIAGLGKAPVLVRALFWLRFRLGALFEWDQPRPAWNAESYAERLSPADRAHSLVAPGTPDGSFRLLYRFE